MAYLYSRVAPISYQYVARLVNCYTCWATELSVTLAI